MEISQLIKPVGSLQLGFYLGPLENLFPLWASLQKHPEQQNCITYLSAWSVAPFLS